MSNIIRIIFLAYFILLKKGVEMKILFFFLLVPSLLYGQINDKSKSDSLDLLDEVTKGSVKIIPGSEYEASGFYELFMGSHWRDLWTTEIEANILDLTKYGGGLTPLKRGGSFQTKSLRFEGNDGKLYKFRSINKDPSQNLPPHLKNSVVADILKDQTSISNPVAAVIVPRLLNELGILNAEPKIFVLPDDERLGKFQKEFGGLLGTLEEHPSSKENGKGGFKGFEEIVTGFKIYEVVEKDNKNKIEEVELLKARLVDILIGDRDRHSDQWKWAGYEKDGVRYWKPIPRDRDFAFCLYDGLFPSFASRFEPSSVGYDEDYPSVKNQTFIGRHLDRRFLNSLGKPVWDSVVSVLQIKLTNDVLKDALLNMPKEMYKLKGDYLFETLKERRDNLDEAANDFYELLYEVADVYGTNESEYFEVQRLNDDEVGVIIYLKDESTGLKSGAPIFQRIYNSDITDEIRIFMLDGKNKAVVEGNVDESILVRIVGGSDKDEFIDNSKVNGYFLDVTPIPSEETLTEFYDAGKKTIIKGGLGTYFNTDEVKKPKSIFEKYEPTLDDRYSFLYVDPILNFNSDDGLIVGLNPIITKYGFRSDPNLYSLDFSGAYATKLQDFDFFFLGSFNGLIKRSCVKLNVKATGIEFIDFFGIGNETNFNKDLYKENFYRIKQKVFLFYPSLSFKLTKFFGYNIGVFYEYSHIKDEDNIIKQLNYPYGMGRNSYLGISTGFTFDSRDNIIAPVKGIYFNANGEYYPVIFNNRFHFSKISGDLRTYLSTDVITNITLALRVGGQEVFGTYPFFKYAVLGGGENLRGFSRERFSGDASLFGQAEVRMYLFDMNVLLPGRFGLSFFGESGRVFVSLERSDKWHSSYGCGLWFSVLKNAFNLNFSVAKSTETLKFYVISGFAF